jgi:uncharacterized protein YcbX
MSRSPKESLERSSVVSLINYPIKACKGVQTRESYVERAGLADDRRLMLRYPSGKFVSQRERGNAGLALVSPRYLEPDLLEVTAPGVTEILRVKVRTDGEHLPASVHSATGIQVIDQGKAAQEWFSNYLGKPVQLVAKASDYHRPLKEMWTANSQDETVFADGAPALLTAIESLNALNTSLNYPVNMKRFRPNIVLSGSEMPYVEEQAARIMVGDVIFRLVDLCTRCVVTTINQDEGYPDDRDLMAGQPLKQLVENRYIVRADGAKGGAFGVNCVPENEGTIGIGMPITVLETKPAPIFSHPPTR